MFSSFLPRVPITPISNIQTDLTKAMTDYILAVGETAIYNNTLQRYVALHINTTNQGMYSLSITGDMSVAYSNVTVILSPNNVTQAANIKYNYVYLANNGSVTSGVATTYTTFRLTQQGIMQFNALITTKTSTKTIAGTSFILGTFSSANISCQETFSNYWADTTTPWTSLGTIDLGYAATTQVMVTRLT